MAKKSIEKLSDKEFLFALTKDQVQPALGCTEIGIVSLAAAKAATLLTGKLVSATVYVSLYVYRNDARVGVPRLGLCGMKSIAAAGLILANPQKKLACLDDLTPATIKKALAYGVPSNKTVEIVVDHDAEPVYTRCVATDDKGNVADVLITGSHDNIVSAKLNNKETIVNTQKVSAKEKLDKVVKKELSWDDLNDRLTIKQAYDIIRKSKESELEFLMEGVNMNQKVVDEGLKNPDPTSITKVWKEMIDANDKTFGYSKDNWTSGKVMLATAAAVDARMYGCPLPVMSSSRSGDHGLTVTIPQQVYAKAFNIPKLKMLQAIMLADYICWKIKSKVGHLCGMCGSALAAGCGTLAGIAYQKGWSWEKINMAMNFHMTSQCGVTCDGAKPSCSLKIMASLMAGFTALGFVEQGGNIADRNGFICKDFDQTLRNMGIISRHTQEKTVVSVCEIMNWMSKTQK